MQDTWQTTQQRVADWRAAVDETGVANGWELRRILSSSQMLPQIVHFTVFRSPFQAQALSPEHHWAFGLDKLPEEMAVQMLLDVVSEDLPKWLDEQARRDTQQMLDETRAALHSEDGPTNATGELDSIPLAQLMLRHPRVSIMVFAQRPTAPDPDPTTPPTQD